MVIINLTQRSANPDQIKAGVMDLPELDAQLVRALLTFNELPAPKEIEERAQRLAAFAHFWAKQCGTPFVMIGGALWLMPALTKALRDRNLSPVFAFSTRESAEEKQPDGTVLKRSVFRHLGFVEI